MFEEIVSQNNFLPALFKNLLMPHKVLNGLFSRDFQEGKRPLIELGPVPFLAAILRVSRESPPKVLNAIESREGTQRVATSRI